MKVRSVIIDSLNLDPTSPDVEKLSEFIAKVLSQKRNPIVLINDDGDELLRKIPKLFDCDLVYSQKSENKFEGLLAGLHGAGTCAFYLPIGQNYGDENTWLELEKNLIQLPYLNTTHILIPKADGPWLITSAGVLYLKNQESSWNMEKDSDFNKIYI